MAFDLKDGRRKESLPRSAGGQRRGQPVGRQPADSGPATCLGGRSAVLAALAPARPRSGAAGGGNRGLPFFGGGAVGYQPVISWFCPKAPTSGVTAVVSADRRYVRITRIPLVLRRSAGQYLQHGHAAQARRKPAAPATKATAARSAAPATPAPAAAF